MQATGLVPGCRATLCRRRPQEYIRVAMFSFRFTLNVNIKVMASVSSDAAGEWQRNWNKIKGDLAIAKSDGSSDTSLKIQREKIQSEYSDEMTNTWSNIIVLYQLYNHRHLYQSTFAAAAKNAPLTSAEFRENFHKLRIICEMTEFTMAVQHLQMQMVRFNLKYKKLKEGQSLQCDVNVLQEFGDDKVEKNQFDPETELKALVTLCDSWLTKENEKIKNFITTDQSKYIKYGVLKTLMEEKEEKLRRVLEKAQKIFYQFMFLKFDIGPSFSASIILRPFEYGHTNLQVQTYSAAAIGVYPTWGLDWIFNAAEAVNSITTYVLSNTEIATLLLFFLLFAPVASADAADAADALARGRLRDNIKEILRNLNINDNARLQQLSGELTNYVERNNLVKPFTKLQNISNQIDAGEQFVHFLCHVISSYRITN